MYPRFLECLLIDPEIKGAMAFIAGPRQVGKTTCAKNWLEKKGGVYVNWDDEATRRRYRQDSHFFESELRQSGPKSGLVLDEIHKIPKWKTLIKGYYDTLGTEFDLLVTGSARLEYFHQSGDSMLGRYHLLHMSPLVPHEVLGKVKKKSSLVIDFSSPVQKFIEQKMVLPDALSTLIDFSGFPGIYQKQSQRALNLWHREYRQRLIREDLHDLTRIIDYLRAEHLYDLLPHRVGSPLSLNSLREDLNASHEAIRLLMAAFEKLYILFHIKPYFKKVAYSLKKEPKIYFYDWTQIPDAGARFEDFIAVQLKAFCDFVSDGGWASLELFYLRTKQKREVDFLVVKDKKPWMMVEVKNGEGSYTKTSLDYFHQLLKPEVSVCVSAEPGIFKKVSPNQWNLSAVRFMNLLWERVGFSASP